MEDLSALRCLLIQTQLFWADAGANRRHLEAIVRRHAGAFDVAVFPETFSSGFLGDASLEPEDMEGATVTWLQQLSTELSCVLCGSAAIAGPRGTANRFLWAEPGGGVHYYDKRHLFAFGGEDERYAAGIERKVFSYRGWRVCPQICYDLRFPVWCRNRGDYDALIFVANWPEPRTAAWTALLRARAIENQCYVIAVNRSGRDPRGLVYKGCSAVYDPLGETVVDLGTDENTAVAVADLQTVIRVREELPFLQDADQVPYSV